MNKTAEQNFLSTLPKNISESDLREMAKTVYGIEDSDTESFKTLISRMAAIEQNCEFA